MIKKIGRADPSTNDKDGDGCRDDKDIDDDGDGLIEIATAEGLYEVRYQLDGTGLKSSFSEKPPNTTGCGGGGDIRFCNGYELIGNIKLDKPEYANWVPLGSGKYTENGCEEEESRGREAFKGIFEGNGKTISNLSINHPNQNCIGLFGYIAAGSEIRNLRLHADKVIGGNAVGALVGDGEGARIHSSSVVVAEVGGMGVDVGGLVGWGRSAQIFNSSVVARRVYGMGEDSDVGGLVGFGFKSKIYSSLVVADEVSGGGQEVGGLVGDGEGNEREKTQIYSSSVVAGKLRGMSKVGGLVGSGDYVQIFSSSIVAGEVHGGGEGVGGLVGSGDRARIFSSLVAVGKLDGKHDVGGLVGGGNPERKRHSYSNQGEYSIDAFRKPTHYKDRKIYQNWNKERMLGDGAISGLVW